MSILPLSKNYWICSRTLSVRLNKKYLECVSYLLRFAGKKETHWEKQSSFQFWITNFTGKKITLLFSASLDHLTKEKYVWVNAQQSDIIKTIENPN